jgi:CBS domain-containing protein
MKVELVMTKNVGRCTAGETLNDAARIMWERDCGIVPIVESAQSARLVGVITDRDICVAAYTKGRPLPEIPIAEVMAKRVVSCRTTDELKTAEAAMCDAQVYRLPVIGQGDQLVGVLSLADIARATQRGNRQAEVSPLEVGETLAAIRRSRTLPMAQAF